MAVRDSLRVEFLVETANRTSSVTSLPKVGKFGSWL
jgi:hypothetical protein